MRADDALYEAKENGRDQIRAVDNHPDRYDNWSLTQINMLFFLAFVFRIFPFYGFSLALMKQWNRKSLFCIISYFVPMTVMIADLGEQMFSKACAFMASEDVKNSPLQCISVNLSPLQCVDAALANTYIGIYERYHLKPGSVFLEVTEQSLEDSSVLHKQIVRLQSEGLSFVLDDFGSMSSNMERLKENPFVGVKLDKKMVWSYMETPDFIVQHVIAACHEMEIKVAAEGIETEKMASVFRDLGCDFFQGYYYSRPVPKEEFLCRYSFNPNNKQ